MLTLPTGDAERGARLGGIAFDASGVLSKWLSNKVVVTGEFGYNFRQNPEEPVVVHVPNYFRWGGGVGLMPTPNWLIHGELLGRTWQRDNTSLDSVFLAEDGTVSPIITDTDATTSFATGVTWIADRGFFIGAELRWDTPSVERINASEDSSGDYARLPGPHRLGSASRATGPTGAASRDPATTGGPGESSANREGRLQPLHGVCR